MDGRTSAHASIVRRRVVDEQYAGLPALQRPPAYARRVASPERRHVMLLAVLVFAIAVLAEVVIIFQHD
jgi:hypothetical protein